MTEKKILDKVFHYEDFFLLNIHETLKGLTKAYGFANFYDASSTTHRCQHNSDCKQLNH